MEILIAGTVVILSAFLTVAILSKINGSQTEPK